LRQEFNHVRPHASLSGKTPAEVYKPTEKRKPRQRPYAYPAGRAIVRVRSQGTFTWCGASYFLGKPFEKNTVAIETIDPLHVRVWFCDIDLGLLEVTPAVNDATYEMVEEPRRNKRGPRAV
jgi:hypothetical protein